MKSGLVSPSQLLGPQSVTVRIDHQVLPLDEAQSPQFVKKRDVKRLGGARSLTRRQSEATGPFWL
jgi:hypothetical protein